MEHHPHKSSDTGTRKWVVCRWCGFGFEGNFCPQCGCKAESTRLKLNDIVADGAVKSPFGANLLHTVRMLYTRPGLMISEYLLGKRDSYTNPFTLLLFSCGLYGLTFMFFFGSRRGRPGIGYLRSRTSR